MDGLQENLTQVVSGLWGILTFLIDSALPWLGVVAWLAFWLFAVNWRKLSKVLHSGGWVGVVLIGLVMVLVWGSIAPPPSGQHALFGLLVSNYVGKFVYVTILFCLMLLCGTVQLSGYLGGWARFNEPEPEPEHHGHHDAHHEDSHGHHDTHAAHH